MRRFWAYIRQLNSIVGWVVKAAVAAPLLDIIMNIGPPWPPRTATAIIMCMSEFLVFGLVFEFLGDRRWTKNSLATFFAISTVGFFIAILTYIYEFSNSVVDAPDPQHRVVVGSEPLPNILESASINGVKPNDKELLDLHEGDPFRVWTRSSIRANRVKLLTSWIALWLLWSTAISSFVILRRNPAPP